MKGRRQTVQAKRLARDQHQLSLLTSARKVASFEDQLSPLDEPYGRVAHQDRNLYPTESQVAALRERDWRRGNREVESHRMHLDEYRQRHPSRIWRSRQGSFRVEGSCWEGAFGQTDLRVHHLASSCRALAQKWSLARRKLGQLPRHSHRRKYSFVSRLHGDLYDKSERK